MKSEQPNFEKVKTLFYQSFVDRHDVDIFILFDTINSDRLLPTFHNRIKDFKKDFNLFLDRLDIRCVGQLIDGMVSNGVYVPIWMREKRYVIEYNDNGFLDLVIIG